MAETREQAATATDYVVLERVVLHATEGAAGREAWAPLLNQRSEQGPDGQPRVVAARSAEQAIKIATEEPDAHRAGDYKAVPVRSWRGGLRIESQQKIVTTFAELD